MYNMDDPIQLQDAHVFLIVFGFNCHVIMHIIALSVSGLMPPTPTPPLGEGVS